MFRSAISLFLCLAFFATSARAEGAMGGPWLLVVLAIPIVVVAVPIWPVMRWVKSGHSDSHERYRNKAAEMPPVGRLGE
jgi:hypothetical protein